MSISRFIVYSPYNGNWVSTKELQIDNIHEALKLFNYANGLFRFLKERNRIAQDNSDCSPEVELISKEHLDGKNKSFGGDLYLINMDAPCFCSTEHFGVDAEFEYDETGAYLYLEPYFDCRRLGLPLEGDDSVNVYVTFKYPEDTLQVSCIIHYGDGTISKELIYGSLSQEEEQVIRGAVDDMCRQTMGDSLKSGWIEHNNDTADVNQTIPASQCSSIRLDAKDIETAASNYLSRLFGRNIRTQYGQDESETLHYWSLWVSDTPLTKSELEKLFTAVDADDSDRDSTDIGDYPIRELCRGVAERILEQVLPFQVDYSIGMENGVWFFSAAEHIEINYEKNLLGDAHGMRMIPDGF